MTRRGMDIGKWFFQVFSMLPLPVLYGKATLPSNHPNPHSETVKMAFPNLFWGDIQATGPETFCIFRNYGSGLKGLRDVSFNQLSSRWRLAYENKGSNEWNTQLAQVSHRIQLTKNQQLGLGLGGIKTQSKTGGLINLQFQFSADKSGTFTAVYRNVFTTATFQSDFKRRLFWGPSLFTAESSWQYQEKLLQVTWVGNTSLKTTKANNRNAMIPFIQATHSPQQQFLEVGAMKYLGSGLSGMLALNSTQQPLRWGIYYTKKSWSGGLEGKWLRPLGMVYGWQVRYRWE